MKSYDVSHLKNVQKNVGFYFLATWSGNNSYRAYDIPDTPEYNFLNSSVCHGIEQADIRYLSMKPIDFYKACEKAQKNNWESLPQERKDFYLELFPDLHKFRKEIESSRQDEFNSMLSLVESYDTLEHIPAEKLKTEMRIYWAGVALVTFQWYSGISFKEILSMVPFSEIFDMSYGYATDTTFDDFIEDMNRRYTERKENLTIHHI